MGIVDVVTRAPLRRGQKGDAVFALQVALQAHGHQLVADGDFGGITEAAVKRFQAAHWLDVDGVVGSATARALDGVKAAPSEPPLPSSLAVAPWLSVMRAITGTQEIPGARSNPLILQWRDEIIAKYPDMKGGLAWYTNDDTPWCGLGNAYSLAHADFRPAQEPLWALNNGDAWVREGRGVRLSGPALGAIVTLKRDGGGHVTQYEGEDADYWFGRGCNQSNSVNVSRFPKARKVEGYFWPAGHPLPPIGPVRVSFAAAREGTEA